MRNALTKHAIPCRTVFPELVNPSVGVGGQKVLDPGGGARSQVADSIVYERFAR